MEYPITVDTLTNAYILQNHNDPDLIFIQALAEIINSAYDDGLRDGVSWMK